MRFPIATIILLIICFIMFAGFAILSFVHGEIEDALDDQANITMSATSKTHYNDNIENLRVGFAYATLGLFIVACISYVVDCLRSESESFTNWREK